MRLSEAIRLGAMLKPQGFGHKSDRDNPISSCAFEAAQEAIGRNTSVLYIWPWLATLPSCPVCGCIDRSVQGGSLISVHLNDRHKWTREQIADWVATVEPREDERPGPENQNVHVHLCTPEATPC